METATLDFVKAHAGWDECIFVKGDQLPTGKEVETCLQVLRKPGIGGIETGILYPPQSSGDLRLKMVDDTSKGYIKMCGGITQTIGKVIVETEFVKNWDLPIQEGKTHIRLETDAGLIPIAIWVENGRATKVETDMSAYVADCYERGVQKVMLEDMEVVNVGITETDREYLAVEAAEMGKKYPDLDFWDRSPKTLSALESVYKDFMDSKGYFFGNLYGILYQVREKNDKNRVRAVFRFAPWNYTGGNDLEFGCGTGSVALAIAMHAKGSLQVQNGSAQIGIFVGKETIPDHRVVKTEMRVEADKTGIKRAWLSHNRIQLIAEGKLHLW